MIDELKKVSALIGNTPLRRLKNEHAHLHAKLEYANLTGSIKDRAAFNVLYQAIKRGEINQETTIVESSSGNFAIALATICSLLGLRFIPVIDPNVNKDNEKLLRYMVREVVKVSKPDHTGGYLLTRIQTVQDLCQQNPNSYWPNQYANPDNYLSYYHTLGVELCQSFTELHYAFIAVSSGGTITGTSRRLKEKFPNVKIVAVDVEGSVIFGTKPAKRYVSGIGASKVPVTLKNAIIDDVVMVSHADLFQGCQDLLSQQSVFGGASAGAVYCAANRYLSTHCGTNSNGHKPNAVFICPDKGSSYLDTVYNQQWIKTVNSQQNEYVLA